MHFAYGVLSKRSPLGVDDRADAALDLGPLPRAPYRSRTSRHYETVELDELMP